MLSYNITNQEKLSLDPSEGRRSCQIDNECYGARGQICNDGFCTFCPGEIFAGGPLPCRTSQKYGASCEDDIDCTGADNYLVCGRSEEPVCRCQRGYLFNTETERCQRTDDRYYSYPGGKFDPVRDFIIPGIIVMTLGAMIYLGVKLFCNCGKLWRSRHRDAELPHVVEDPHHPQQTPLVSFHRGFSSLNEISMFDRSPPLYCPGVTTSHYLLPPATGPDIYLTAPGPAVGAVVASPPPYEEALKHKIILSSCATSPGCTSPRQLITQPVSVYLPDLERNGLNT